jgi:hypothetical protein
MRVVSTRVASRLTGLSTNKLREWTSRRALIPADIRPRRQGSPAQYTWQTILLLRVAVTLREHFHMELQAHRAVFTRMRSSLRRTSFLALWGKSLVIYPDRHWTWLDDAEARPVADALIIRLDPHLDVLSQSFALRGPPALTPQRNLSPAPAVIASSRHSSASLQPSARGRRSA